jgi:asparagine synthase (glutamine-hydrolysing)
MCGIFVAFSKKEISLDLDKCRCSLDKMSHRGPDHMFDSLHLDGRLYMGQTILSITGSPDLQLLKYQTSNNNQFNLLLNGEIYNYDELSDKYLNRDFLKTNTDTEVLVNLYEVLSPEDVVSELKGMYAYCVYDSKKQNLYISRDLIGEKILYRYEDNDLILFASEISTITHFLGEHKINYESIYQYFYSRHLLATESTEFQGIKAFPAGHGLVISLPESTEKTIYIETLKDLVSVEQYERLNNMTESEVLDELDSICQNTAKRLQPCVKYASVFSGGVDSSIASWYMLQEENKPSLLTGLVFGEKDQISRKLYLFEKKINTNILSTEVSEQWFIDSMEQL